MQAILDPPQDWHQPPIARTLLLAMRLSRFFYQGRHWRHPIKTEGSGAGASSADVGVPASAWLLIGGLDASKPRGFCTIRRQPSAAVPYRDDGPPDARNRPAASTARQGLRLALAKQEAITPS